MTEKNTNSPIDKLLRWWIIKKLVWRHFALIAISFPVKLSLTKNKRSGRKQCSICGLWLRRSEFLLSIAQMIEKWNYLYLFIIHDAGVIKYLCLSFSRFVLDFFLSTTVELCFVFVINHALHGCKMAEKNINKKLIFFDR